MNILTINVSLLGKVFSLMYSWSKLRAAQFHQARRKMSNISFFYLRAEHNDMNEVARISALTLNSYLHRFFNSLYVQKDYYIYMFGVLFKLHCLLMAYNVLVRCSLTKLSWVMRPDVEE